MTISSIGQSPAISFKGTHIYPNVPAHVQEHIKREFEANKAAIHEYHPSFNVAINTREGILAFKSNEENGAYGLSEAEIERYKLNSVQSQFPNDTKAIKYLLGLAFPTYNGNDLPSKVLVGE